MSSPVLSFGSELTKFLKIFRDRQLFQLAALEICARKIDLNNGLHLPLRPPRSIWRSNREH